MYCTNDAKVKTFIINNLGSPVNLQASSSLVCLSKDSGIPFIKHQRRYEKRSLLFKNTTWSVKGWRVRTPNYLDSQIKRQFLLYAWASFPDSDLLLGELVMKAFRRMLYPRTDSGRARYVRHGLRPRYQIKLIFAILIVIGISGMVVTGLFFCSFLLFILSMLIFLLGVQGLKERSESWYKNLVSGFL